MLSEVLDSFIRCSQLRIPELELTIKIVGLRGFLRAVILAMVAGHCSQNVSASVTQYRPMFPAPSVC